MPEAEDESLFPPVGTRVVATEDIDDGERFYVRLGEVGTVVPRGSGWLDHGPEYAYVDFGGRTQAVVLVRPGQVHAGDAPRIEPPAPHPFRHYGPGRAAYEEERRKSQPAPSTPDATRSKTPADLIPICVLLSPEERRRLEVTISTRPLPEPEPLARKLRRLGFEGVLDVILLPTPSSGPSSCGRLGPNHGACEPAKGCGAPAAVQPGPTPFVVAQQSARCSFSYGLGAAPVRCALWAGHDLSGDTEEHAFFVLDAISAGDRPEKRPPSLLVVDRWTAS